MMVNNAAAFQIVILIINISLILLVPVTLYFIIKWAVKKALREFYFEYRLEEQRSKEIREKTEKNSITKENDFNV